MNRRSELFFFSSYCGNMKLNQECIHNCWCSYPSNYLPWTFVTANSNDAFVFLWEDFPEEIFNGCYVTQVRTVPTRINELLIRVSLQSSSIQFRPTSSNQCPWLSSEIQVFPSMKTETMPRGTPSLCTYAALTIFHSRSTKVWWCYNSALLCPLSYLYREGNNPREFAFHRWRQAAFYA